MLLAVCVLSVFCSGSMVYAKGRTDPTASAWSRKKNSVTCVMPGGSRTYHLYNQRKYGLYFSSKGCVTTGVSIAASGFGVNAAPKKIRKGKATDPFSERYALAAMGMKSSKVKNEAISLRTASQILTDMGIPNRAVTSYSKGAAVDEIRQHLLGGKPVIVKVKQKRWKGIQFTVFHHTLVLIGIVGENVIFINPATGGVNDSRVGLVNDKINLPLKSLVNKFMYTSKKHTKRAYTKRPRDGGGYILVG